MWHGSQVLASGRGRAHAYKGVFVRTLEGRVGYTHWEAKEEGAFQFGKLNSMDYCFPVTL